MRIAIIGAGSAIAVEMARLYAAQSAQFILAARSLAKLEPLAADLKIRGAVNVQLLAYDAALKTPQPFLDSLLSQPLDLVLVAHGVLNAGDDLNAFVHTNFTSYMDLLEPIAQHMEQQGFGTIAAIGSVAGDRGRKGNYLYGACKAGIDAYLSGLRNRLHAKNVHVLTIKPGFVKTPMTAGFNCNGPLWASAEKVAADSVAAIQKRQNILYTPWFWRYIMLVIKHIPEALFKRMSI